MCKDDVANDDKWDKDVESPRKSWSTRSYQKADNSYKGSNDDDKVWNMNSGRNDTVKERHHGAGVVQNEGCRCIYVDRTPEGRCRREGRVYVEY